MKTTGAKKRVAKKRAQAGSGDYHLSLTVADKTVTSGGDTALEALEALVQPLKLSMKGSLTVERYDEKSKTTKTANFLMPVPKLKRLMISKVVRQQFANWITLRLS